MERWCGSQSCRGLDEDTQLALPGEWCHPYCLPVLLAQVSLR
jgi:hypothetical protein